MYILVVVVSILTNMKTQKEIILLIVIAKRHNDYIDEAIKQKNKVLSEIIKRELSREEKDLNYEVTYTLKDLNQVKDYLDLIKHHVWIQLSSIYRPDLNQRIIKILKLIFWSRHLKAQQVRRENQNPVTVSNSITTLPSTTVRTFGTTFQQRR
ncbi:hypothetical protein Glove_673g50 [Diversispora epigaea]|uniref:Uncharacterized protein n=1 Tax=Diversispora epigaea TaxID=1348612 RepID=A0A397G4F6_9GLOM|nr:hypothetical protein Glove_673g50 [Diversispora epigaea]